MVDVPYDAIADAPPAEVPEVELYHPKSWWTQYVFSQDAKVIAIQYSLTATAIGLVALVLSWLMRLQLGFPGTFSFIDANQYLQFITMHGMIMVIYLLTALFLGGFGNYLIPLMVGARDMVFPYVNMLSYWIYLLAVVVLASTFFVPGGPTGAGWTLYPPQAILSGTPGQDWGIVLMLASLILFIIGFTMGGLNYVVTVLQARTRGMTLMRMPLTVWGIFTATVMALLAFPALFVASVMMLFDRLLGTSFFMPALVEMGQQMKYGGGSPILFQHLFWFFGHPEVYIVALPAFGIVSDLISTHARKNIFGYRMMVWAIVGIGALSFVVWAHHMYVSGMHPHFGFFFATTTLIIAIPTAIKVYNWVLTLWRGDIHLTPPMLFALGFIITFVNGGLTGLFLGNVVVDVPLSDTMFVVAHFHMVMGVAPIMVVLGAIYHWYPKVTGRMLNDALGKFHFWVTFLGAYLIFFPMHYIGLLGVPRRYHDIGEAAFIPSSTHTLNAFITVMALIVGFAQMVFLFNLAWSLFRGRPSGGNPWRATTLEWQTPETPPGHGNWGKELPVVYRWAYDYSVPGAAAGLHSAEPATNDAGPSGSRSVSAIVLFMAVIAVIVGWWLSQQRLTAKPWLEEGGIGDLPGADAMTWPAAKIGLGVFLAVAGSLFALFISAYSMRMNMVDWRTLPVPGLLWFNTGVLVLSSVALQWAYVAARRDDMDNVIIGLCAGGASAVTFLIGQLLAWQQLRAAGYFVASNPANSFFYLITAAHGLHLMGGLVALGRTTAKVWRGAEMAQVRLSVELCTIYWHFLLLVWLVLLGLLTGWTDDFVDICRRLLN